jgi:putative DNA primase/helicase
MKISEFLTSGFSIIPIGTDKKPIGKWKEYQSVIMPIEEAKIKFKGAPKIAVVCGAVSGNAECIDVDLKYDETGDLYQRLTAAIPADIFKKFVIQKTISGGYHFWYRCSEIEGNLKLATREDNNVLIETRGEGGYAIVHPSAGYEMIQGIFSEIKELTPAERKTVLDICRSFCLKNAVIKIEITQPKAAPTDTEDKTPWDDFNEQHSPLDILLGYGWTVIRNNGAHVEVGRPGQDKKEKSGIVTANAAYIHSTSTCLPTEQNLTAFGIYAWYEHSGDIKKAASDLLGKGYGTKPKSRKNSEPYTVPPRPKTQYNLVQPSNNKRFIDGYFMPLGFNKMSEGVQNFYFYVNSCKSIISLSAAKMTTNNLLMLAPLDYWVTKYPAKSGFDNKAVADWLIELCNACGYFTEEIIRGRGAWLDRERIIIHSGNCLIVDGRRMELGECDTEYLYEMGKTMKLSVDNPLSSDDATKLYLLLDKLDWANRANSVLLTGWLAIAPLCGVLEWRPHLWITGSAGSGKSWVFGIVTRMIKNISISAQSDSSASGIRQALNNDALNVIFDEAEGNTERDKEGMENVMSLMRAASSGNAAPILKGSQTGQAKEFFVRACFAFASINPQFDKQSDVRRITLLELIVNKDTNKFVPIKDAFKKLITDEYIHSFQARSINNIHKILKSIQIFADQITVLAGSRAVGDQLGTILGGFWHVGSDSIVTDAEAHELSTEIIELLKINSPETKEAKDEEACLQVILSKQERIESEGIPTVKTVGEIVEIASSRPTSLAIKQSDADDCLRRLGLRVITDKEGTEYLAILNKSQWVISILKNTPWLKSYSKVLKRINGAESAEQRFSSGIKGACVMIPLSEIFK